MAEGPSPGRRGRRRHRGEGAGPGAEGEEGRRALASLSSVQASLCSMTAFRPRTLTVLLVEDSPTTQKLQSKALEGAGRFRALMAANGREALDLLRQERVDAVVTDLQMPVMDGFELIAELSTRYPGLPIFVLTDIPDQARVDPSVAESTLQILAKPPDYPALATQIYAVRNRPQGFVRGVSLPGLLQLLQWEGRDATITVHSEASLGRLYVRKGKLIQAEAGDLAGLDAAYLMCEWPAPSVEFVDACRVEASFALSAEELQMGLALRRDEHQA
ncbi:MAG: response regulator [Acidobacteria bacterium]|nr:response regulator [Acidobacteriota bacterium]